MDLLTRTLCLCLAFALTRAGPLQDSTAAGAGKLPKCSDVKLGAITESNDGTTYIFPDITDRHFEHHRKRIEARGFSIRAYKPQCDDNGMYQPQQRHGSTGYSWCVDSKGREKPGTATPPGVPDVDCSRPDEPQRLCQKHLDELKGVDTSRGVYVPVCDENGEYQPYQCHAGQCHCVDQRGIKLPGTETRAGSPPPDCSKADKPKGSTTKCQKHRDGTKTTTAKGHPIAGAFVPECDQNGEYLPKQCHSSTGHCWCVNSRGEEMPGTKTPPGTPQVDCKKAVTHCERHRARVGATSTPVGAFVPECDENGHAMAPLDLVGVWMKRGEKNKEPELFPVQQEWIVAPQDLLVFYFHPTGPRHRCDLHRAQIQNPPPGAFVPKCEEDGHYSPRQFHSTGSSWCVDKFGQERPGTRTPPGRPPVDCDKASRVYTRLDTIRDGLHSLPATRAWQEVGDRVDAAFLYDNKMHLIKENEVYVYQVGSNFTLDGNRRLYLQSELGIEGSVDAAFVCPDEHIVHVIQGNRMRDVDLSATPRVVIRDRPLPLSDIDAALCGLDSVKVFKGSEYYHYESPKVMAAARIAPRPQKITSAILECED